MVQRIKKQVLTRQNLSKTLTPNTIKRVNRDIQKKNKAEFDRQIREIDEALLNTATVQEAKEIYNSLSPGVKRNLTTTPQKVQQIQNNRIKTIQKRVKKIDDDIKDSKRKEKKYRDRDDDRREIREEARQKGYREEIKELKKFLPRLEKGEILDTNKVIDFAQDVGRAERRQEEAEELEDLREKQVAKQVAAGKGDVTKVNFKNGVPSSVKVNGKTISLKGLSKKERENIKLSSVKRAEIDKLNKKINQGKTLSVQDFEKARELGVKSSDILERTQKQFELMDTYNKALKKFESGKVTSSKRKKIFNDLIKLGLGGDALTNLVNAYEQSPTQLKKVKDENFDKIWKKLSSKKGGLITVDKNTLDTAYKSTVNQELRRAGLEPVSLSSNIDKYEKEYNKLLDKREEVRKALTKDVKQETINKLLENQLSLEDKARTGQSMTPKEIKLWKKQIDLQGKKLTKQQINIAKKLWNLPAVYAASLTVRKRQGEKNPLYTDFTKIGKGALKELQDFVNLIAGVKGVTINSKGESFDGIIATGARAFLDYETRVIKELTQGKDVKDVIGDDLKKIAKKSKQIGKSTVNVTKFIKENPIGTLIIVSAAIVAGVVASKREFLKNPEENIGRAIAWLFPTKRLFGVINKLSNPIAVKYGKNTFDVSSDLVKGTSVIKGNIKGKLQNGKNFVTNYVLRYNPKQKKFKGFQKTKVGKKTYKEDILLEDKGNYYIDTKTGEKISKRVSPVKKQNIRIKETTITPKDNRDIFNIKGDINQKEQTATVKTIVTKIADGLQKQTTRISGVAKRVNKDTGKLISGLGEQLSKTTTKAKKIQRFKQLTPLQVKQVESFFKDISYSKTLLEGLDKRTRIARALGLRKNSNKIEALKELVDKKGNIKLVFKQARVKQKGEILLGKKPVKIKFNIKMPKGRSISSLRKNKKGSISLVKDDKIDLRSIGKSGKLEIDKTIKIPSIKPKLPLTKANIKLYGIGKLLIGLSRKLYSIKQDVQKGNIKTAKDLEKQIKSSKDIIKKINKQIKKVDTKTKTKTVKKIKQKTITKPSLKTKPKKITKIQSAITPTIKITKPPKIPRKLKLPKFGFDSNKLNNKVAMFEAKYRERRNKNKPFNKKSNPVVTKTIRKRTTKNRMLKLVADRTDKSLVRSMNIIVKGVTNQKKKDIKKPAILNKFRQKKNKNTPVLQLVEKSKFAQDTKGEKNEIKKIKKRVKTKKSTKSKKKASARSVKRVSKVSKQKKSSKKSSKKVSSKKTFKTKKSAEKNLKKGQSVYKVKGGWRRTSL